MSETEDSNSNAPTPLTHPNSLRNTYAAAAGAAVDKIAGSGVQFPEHLHLMPPPSSFPLRGRSPMATFAHSSRLNAAGGGRINRQHNLSAEDEAAVEAAVEIGYLLSQYSQAEADTLLQNLHFEGNLNIYGATPKAIGPLGRPH
jgi:hypothetical protein